MVTFVSSPIRKTRLASLALTVIVLAPGPGDAVGICRVLVRCARGDSEGILDESTFARSQLRPVYSVLNARVGAPRDAPRRPLERLSETLK
jgi:hypothetical protein